MKPIAGIQPPTRPISPLADPSRQSAGAGQSSGIEDFANLLSNQVQHVNSMQIDANDMVHSMLTGGEVNEAEALTAPNPCSSVRQELSKPAGPFQ